MGELHRYAAAFRRPAYQWFSAIRVNVRTIRHMGFFELDDLRYAYVAKPNEIKRRFKG